MLRNKNSGANIYLKLGNPLLNYMSRLNKKTIAIPSNVTLTQADGVLSFKGPQGERKLNVLPYIEVALEAQTVRVSSPHNHKQARINQGTMWSLIRNAIEGVANGFKKVLEINGVGYRAALEGKTLVLSLGFVNPIRFTPPEDITLSVEKNIIRISGIDKESVGQTAAEIRGFKRPEPYKGKGIRYEGEVVRRKAGKKAATTGS